MSAWRGIVGLLFLALAAASCDSGKDVSRPATPVDPAQAARAAAARRLLAEAGYPDGKGFPKLEVLYNDDEGHKRIGAYLQEEWRKTLGVDVQLRNTEWRVYLDDMSQMRFQMIRRGWIADYKDPNTFIEVFSSHSGNNNSGWTHPDFDRLVEEAEREPDPAKRFELLRRAEAILVDEVPAIPLYFYVNQNCWPDRVKGMHSTLLDIHPLAGVHVEGKDTLVINNSAEPQSLDPGLARGQPEHRITLALFEGLTTYDPETLEARPGVAERWEISEDRKTYRFHLRDCEWSDGRKVVAQDFVYSWLRVLDPATPTDYAHILHYVKGAKEYNLKKGPAEGVAVKAIDDRTLEVGLAHPVPYFLELCAFFSYAPVRRDLIETHGKDWTRPGTLASNGPFKLASWKPTEAIVVERNPAYWNAAAVKQPFIRFLPINNRSTAWNLYEKGEIDVVTTIPLDLVDAIVKRPDYRGGAYLAIYYYGFNVAHGPLKDKRVRKALALAVDRERLVSRITRRGEKPAYHFTPPYFEGYRSPRIDE
jgi:ABC-type oligopeptide transport system substrate-binding subunit